MRIFWLRFWILYYFIVSYATFKILENNFFDWTIMGGATIADYDADKRNKKNST